MNNTFIFGELQAKQYFIYKGGEQEDKETIKENQWSIITHILNQFDDNKTFKNYDIYDNELLHLKVQL